MGYASTAHQVVTGLTPVLGAFGLWGAAQDSKGGEKPEQEKSKGKALVSGSSTPNKESTSSGWGKWAAIGGAVVAGGAAATAWYHREQLTSGVNYGWSYLTDQ
jgi:hypothetical protein